MVKKNERLLEEVLQHYQMWTEDNERRMNRKNGWNDITDAYWGKLPNDWPYNTRIVDPRIRTSLIEKNGRLLNNKLRGHFVPRESGDTIGANINNALIDYQWDSANYGGSMYQKMGISDMDARLYASKFADVVWLCEYDDEGNIIFEGNELMPLDIRDCGIDPSSTGIKDAKWFQIRTWEKIEDLERQVDAHGKPVFKNLDFLKTKLMTKQKKSSTRNTEWTSRIKQLKGLDDRTGEDMAYPIAKIVTERRHDRWITFSPDHKIILRDVPNPYAHKKLSIAQLRYYPLQDDPLGESEVEPVLPIWLAIQATLCAYMDEVVLKMRPPLKIIENQVRIETIQYGPEAQWLVDNQDAVQEMKSMGDAIQYFQTTYQTLVSAFNVAMGDLSAQNYSNVDPFSQDEKTATEVKATMRQQNMRDQKNQNELAEFIKDIVSMWVSNNKQFLLSDPQKQDHVLRVVGQSNFDAFKRAGLADSEPIPGAMEMIQDIITQNPDMSDVQLEQLYETASMPKFPIILNPKEKDPTKIKMKPKMVIGDTLDYADLSIVAADLDGTYDYVPDVKSMASGAQEDLMKARNGAIQMLLNPTVLQQLQMDGERPDFKELLQSTFEDQGLQDAARFFKKIDVQPNQAQAGGLEMGGTPQAQSVGGVPNIPQANPTAGIQQ